MHPLDEHIGYVADQARTERFRAAISATVRSSDRVADIGCGSGFLGMLCLQRGAAFVEAIDETSMIEAAGESFRRAGFGEQVRLHRTNSFRTILPAPVNLVVCDHVGYFGFDYGLLSLLADAKARFLVPGGRLMPRRLDLFLSLVRDPAVVAKRDAWNSPNVPAEFHWLRGMAANHKHAVQLGAGDLLGDAVRLDSLTLGEPAPEFLCWTVELVASRDGVLGGLLGWFRAELAEGVWMTNSPTDPGAIQRPQALLPLETPVAVKAGDRIEVTVLARPDDHLISWRAHHPASGWRCAQSTLKGELLAPADLQRRRQDRRPQLSSLGRARRLVLDYCDGQRSAAEIELMVLREHPDLMPSSPELARFVSQTLARDSE